MALIGNRSILHKSPGRFLSGTAGTLRSGFNKPGMLAGRFERHWATNEKPVCWVEMARS